MKFNWRWNLGLFLVTVASVAFMGVGWGSAWQFASALMSILLVHEFGHYAAARLHRVTTSLPYFLPLPLLSPFGTLGAVIVMPDRIRSRRALLDIGAAGPLAGMAVAIPLMVYGLSLSKLIPRGGEDYVQEGQCLLYWALKYAVHGSIPAQQDVLIHPVAGAAWVGFLVTFLNLLPVGQLDGGHVAYALLGKRQNRLGRYLFYTPSLLFLYNAIVFAWPVVARAATAGSLDPVRDNAPTLVSSLSPWVVFQILFLVFKRRRVLDHPPVDDGALSVGRRAVAVVTLLLFVALFMPSPWVAY